MTIQANLADGRVLEFPDGTDPQVIQATVKRIIGGDAAVEQAAPQEVAPQQAVEPEQQVGPQNITQFRPREEIMRDLQFAQPQGDVAKIRPLLDELESRDSFVGSTRAATELPEIGLGMGVASLLPDIGAKNQLLVSTALLSASDPQEISRILKSASPDIGISQDEAGNLIAANNRTGQQTIINKPGLSGLDVGQFVGRASAFTPSGLASSPARIVGGGLVTESALQGVESAAGGEFNPEAVVTEGAASVVGLGIGRALRGATPADIKKGVVRESLLKRLEAGDAGKDLLGKKAFNGKIFDAGRSAPVNVAKRQGFDERALRVIEVSNPETKSRIRSMVDILEGRKNNARVAATRRSSDPIGGSVFKRYKGLDELRKEAGQELDSVAKTKLKNISVNTSSEISSFYDELQDLGINIKTKSVKQAGKGDVFYHGTNAEVDDFDLKKFGANEPKGDYIGEGVFFSKTKEGASKYGKNIKEAKLELKNPLVINNAQDRKEYIKKIAPITQDIRNKYPALSDDNLHQVKYMGMSEKQKKAAAISMGYDGLIDNLYGQAAVFEPSQIKKLAASTVKKLDLSQMDVINPAPTKKALERILPRLKDDMSALQAHKLKKLIDDAVEYKGLPTDENTLPKALESSLKNLRVAINEKIGESSSEYAAANLKFSQAAEPLSQMDKMFKSMLGLSESQSIETGIGTKASRTLMSNNATRGAMLDVLEQADSVLKANGREFKDDLINQVVVIDELERMFGSEATASFTGASARAVEQKGIEAAGTAMGIPLDLLRTGIEAVKGVNEEAAIKALKKMIK